VVQASHVFCARAPFTQQDLALMLYYASHYHPGIEVVCIKQEQQQQLLVTLQHAAA
jgi:hypothetical protein